LLAANYGDVRQNLTIARLSLKTGKAMTIFKNTFYDIQLADGTVIKKQFKTSEEYDKWMNENSHLLPPWKGIRGLTPNRKALKRQSKREN
jgi:hypothetical protein